MNGILVELVGNQYARAHHGRRNLHHAVLAGYLVLLVQGEVVEPGAEHGEIRFAGDDLQVVGLAVDDLGLNVVHVGQLVAGRVHLPVVGVAHVALAGVGTLGEDPGVLGGLLQVLLRAPEEVVVERLVPGVETLFLGQCVGVGVVVDVPLLEVVEGVEYLPTAAGRAGVLGEQRVVRLVGFEAYGVIVDLDRAFDLGDPVPGGDLVVPVRVLVHEHVVVGGHRVAVRPLGALAQVECHAHRVVGHFGAPHQQRLQRIGIGVGAYHVAADLGLVSRGRPTG